MASGRSRNVRIGQGQSRYVIVLSKRMGCRSDLFYRLGAERGRSFKAKQRAGLIAGFDNAVSEQGELIAWRELNSGFGVGGRL